MTDKKEKGSKAMALSESIIEKIEQIRHQFPTEQALLIPLLHLIQESRGWVSVQSMKDSAEYLHLPLSEVRKVATFYTLLNKEQVGKFHLQICTNISCWLNGADHLLQCAEKRLGICCGETTKDNQFTLSEVECLASCGTAPAMQVNNDQYHEQLTERELLKLIDQWERE